MDNEAPYIEEPEAIKLMTEIMASIEMVMESRRDVFDYLFKELSVEIQPYEVILNNITQFISTPNNIK